LGVLGLRDFSLNYLFTKKNNRKYFHYVSLEEIKKITDVLTTRTFINQFLFPHTEPYCTAYRKEGVCFSKKSTLVESLFFCSTTKGVPKNLKVSAVVAKEE
jgi:hypothetical protein